MWQGDLFPLPLLPATLISPVFCYPLSMLIRLSLKDRLGMFCSFIVKTAVVRNQTGGTITMSGWRLRRMTLLVLAAVGFALQGCNGGGGTPEPVAGNIVSATQIASVTKAEATAIFAAAQVPLVPLHDVKVYKISYLT